KGLVAVAAKALAASPDDRWPTASAMAAEIRKAAGLKLAPASTAAAFAKSTMGEPVRARRTRLEGSEDIVQVAPGIEAPVADIIELGSESLLEILWDSVRPPAPPPVPPPSPPLSAPTIEPVTLDAAGIEPTHEEPAPEKPPSGEHAKPARLELVGEEPQPVSG